MEAEKDNLYKYNKIINNFLGDILSKEKKEISEYHSLLLIHNDINNLHHLRVSLRKLRAILRFFKKEIENVRLSEFDSLIKKLIKPTAKTRDFDVFKDEYIKPVFLLNRDSEDFKALIKHAEKKQMMLHELTLEEISSPKYIDLIDILGSLIDRKIKTKAYIDRKISSENKLNELINKRIQGRFYKIFNSQVLVSKISQKELHKLRIRAKELRYTLSSFNSYTENTTKKVEFLKKLQNILGKIHDCYIAEQMLNELNICKDFNKTEPHIRAYLNKIRDQSIDKLYSLKSEF